MKTTKIFSVLSLAIIFFAVTSGFSKKVETLNSKSTQGPVISYQVIIHPEFISTPCSTYVIRVTDETGRIVAPDQLYVFGINKYSFTEKISERTNTNSRRVARLMSSAYPDQFVCSTSLVAAPDFRMGPFLAGHTYLFQLIVRNSSQGNGE